MTDLVMPVLQKIQTDLADLKRDVSSVREILVGHGEKLDELEIYTAYETGIGSQNKADLQDIRKKIKAMEQRLSVLETRS